MSTPSRDLAEIVWGDNGTPIAARFDDPYYSRLDGRAEAGHVFLGGNSLPDRFAGRQGFTIGELGFGTGLNFFETLAAWRAAAPAAAATPAPQQQRAPRGEGRSRGRDGGRDSGGRIVGMGDHVPDFLMREFRAKAG